MADSAGLTDGVATPLRTVWFRCGIAVAAVSIAAIINEAGSRYAAADMPANSFPVAILLVAVLGGFWAGLLATGLAAAVGIFVMQPALVDIAYPQAVRQLAVILMEGVMLSGIGADLDSVHRLRTRSWPARYGAALVVIAFVLALKLAILDTVSRDYPFGLLFAAVAGAAWAGGFGPSLVVTAIAAVAADRFWLKPPHAVGWPGEPTVRLLMFGAKGAVLGLAGTYIYDAWSAAGRQWTQRATAATRYRHLLETIRDYAVFQLDTDGRVATWNAGAARILGWAETTALGRLFSDFSTSQDRASGSPTAELKEAATTGRSERLGWRERADGSRFWAEVVITVGSDGPGYAVVLRDVSARRQAEEAGRVSDEKTRQAQRLEAVGRLAGGIAHDFNNLLTIILGNLDLILEHDAPAEMHKSLLDDVRDAGRRAAVLTRQLLAFSRREPATLERIDLNVIVADMGSMLRRVIAEHIKLTTDLRPGLGPVLADPGQIEQVILNLVVNARDAMPKGGALTIRTGETDITAQDLPPDAESPPGRYVVLAVTDTGHGMDAATRARIFEPFFTTKDVGKGTGLGLATVYGNVKQANGWVTVDSRPGAGSSFRVFLPRVDGEAATAVSPMPAEPRPRGSETILLVEDEAALRDLARRALESAGYTVLSCPDGQAALVASRHFSGPIDLVVTDLVMPLMNGRDLAVQLRGQRPGLPVLLMSGYSESTLANLSGPLPGEELLDKPFLPDDLIKKVRELLDQDVSFG
jgi:PAS domain S-box-containing protein